MSIDLKFIELTADVLEILFIKYCGIGAPTIAVFSPARAQILHPKK